jgi:SpoIID/LytB domain protein
VAGHRYLVGDGVFTAPSNVLTLVTPSGDKVLRGRLRAASPAKGSTDRDTVDVLSVESYVRGVVPAEIPASWSPAAVQAQAIAARTYALFERAANIHHYYELCDTAACQVFGGVDVEDPASDAAVKATAGQYLAYGGQPAFTQFSSSDGGWTSAGSFPYLPHQADPYDGTAGNPVHDWSVVANAGTLEKRYPKIGHLTGITVTAREGGGEWGGRARTVVLTGTTRSVTITGDDFRSALGLRSSWFDLTA